MTTNTKRSIAKALLDIGAVGFSPDSPITFKSGIRSPVYVDNRSLTYYPSAWHAVIAGFQLLIEKRSLEFDLIAGVAVGGVPHSSALAYRMRRPSVFIRKESKGHGQGKRIEGGEVAGCRALLVEDLVTTGGSSLSAVDALRAQGACVTDMLAIISYGFAEAAEAVQRANLRLHALTDFDTLFEIATDDGLLNDDAVARIRDWLNDPHHWAPDSA